MVDGSRGRASPHPVPTVGGSPARSLTPGRATVVDEGNWLAEGRKGNGVSTLRGNSTMEVASAMSA